ncbi:hypothetical protein ACFSL6_05430 [Paenibacillus thailandensis]|uniref:Uncharacterized protein n=1 Tax=Paenibacillus thailandensis TaxID=393250 RepID=A0ABW5QSG4_9BACL
MISYQVMMLSEGDITQKREEDRVMLSYRPYPQDSEEQADDTEKKRSIGRKVMILGAL